MITPELLGEVMRFVRTAERLRSALGALAGVVVAIEDVKSLGGSDLDPELDAAIEALLPAADAIRSGLNVAEARLDNAAGL